MADFCGSPRKTLRIFRVSNQMLEKRVQNIKPTSATPDQVRALIQKLALETGSSLGALSRLMGRNDAYLQQFIRRGTPDRLAEDDRLILAQHFGINERLLGARDPWAPSE